MEETDGGLCPCRSLGLDGKDQRHIFGRRGSCLYGQGLGLIGGSCPSESLGYPANLLAGGSRELGGKVLAGACLPSLLLPCRWLYGWLYLLKYKGTGFHRQLEGGAFRQVVGNAVLRSGNMFYL